MKSVIKNGKVVLADSIIEHGYVEFEGAKIVAVGQGEYVGDATQVVDAQGDYISPGFIDMHTHGAGGHDFMDGTVEAYVESAKMYARHGATSVAPTTLASTNENLFETFDIYTKAKEQNVDGAEFLGLHLEGPYFAFGQKGAQDPRYLRDPRPEEYNEILGASNDIIRMSLAPELNGAMELGRTLRSKGILPSIAHSDAIFEETLEAFENGYTHVTHLYSCTSSVVRRDAFRYAGIVEAAYFIDDMTVEIIADGVHLPKSLLQFVYKFKGADKIALITDSMRGAGMPEGESVLGALSTGLKVIIEDGVAKLPDRSAFAGSVATADRCVRTMIELAEIPLVDAVKMMSLTPARIMKVDARKGSLTVGKDADIIIFDENIKIKKTIISGRQVY